MFALFALPIACFGKKKKLALKRNQKKVSKTPSMLQTLHVCLAKVPPPPAPT